MPTARSGVAAAASGGAVYAIGGQTFLPGALSTTATNIVERYDIATDSWTSVAPLPAVRSYAAVAAWGDSVYAMGGYTESGGAAPEPFIYDVNGDVWTTGAPMQEPRYEFSAVALNGLIYAIGGTGESTAEVATVEIYDPETNTWSPGPPLPDSLSDFAAATDGQRIYVAGGFTWTSAREIGSRDVLYIFDPLANGGAGAWSVGPNLPETMLPAVGAFADGQFYVLGDYGNVTNYAYSVATDMWETVPAFTWWRSGLGVASVDGKVVVCGGDGFEHAPLATVEVLDPSGIAGGSGGPAWVAGTDMPNARLNPQAVVSGGAVYAIGGDTVSETFSNTPTNIVERYDVASDMWSAVGALPVARHGFAAAAWGDAIYAMGGTSDFTNFSAELHRYNVVSGSWTSGTPMPTARTQFSTVALGGLIYAIGGYSSSDYVDPDSTVDIYHPDTDTWTSGPHLPEPLAGFVAATDGQRIYVTGGYGEDAFGNNGSNGSLHIFDPQANGGAGAWSTGPTLPHALSSAAGAFAGGQFLVTGGDNNLGEPSSSVFAYSPDTDSWRIGPALLNGRRTHAAAVVNDTVVVYGGADDNFAGTITASVELLDLSGTTGGGGGDAPLSVVSTTPTDGALDVPLDRGAVDITFNAGPVDGGTITVVGASSGTVSHVPAISGNTLSLDVSGHVFTAGEIVTVTLSDIPAPPGFTALASHSFSFTMAAGSGGGGGDYVSGSGSIDDDPGTADTGPYFDLATGTSKNDSTGAHIAVDPASIFGWAPVTPGVLTVYRFLSGSHPASALDDATSVPQYDGTNYYSRVSDDPNAFAEEVSEGVVIPGDLWAVYSRGTYAVVYVTSASSENIDNAQNYSSFDYKWQPNGTNLFSESPQLAVVSTTPTDGAMDVPVGLGSVTITFNAGFVDGGTIAVTGAQSGAVTLAPPTPGQTMTLDVSGHTFTAGEVVTVTLSSIPAEQGFLALASHSFSFTMATSFGGGDVAWTAGTDMPTARYLLAAAESGGAVYAVGGGQANFAGMSTVERYDFAGDSWTTVASLPSGRMELAAAAIGGKVYAMGGREGASHSASLFIYDVAGDSWTTGAPLPSARSGLGAVALNGLIYAIGGYSDDQSSLTSVDIYDPVANTWTSGPPLPQPREGVAAATDGQRIYVAGGLDNGPGNVSDSLYVFDPLAAGGTGAWSQGPNLPVPTQYGAGAFAKGRFYVIGGLENWSPIVSSVHAYVVATDTWEPAPAINVARSQLGAAAVNDRLAAVGGFSAGVGAIATVETIDPPVGAGGGGGPFDLDLALHGMTPHAGQMLHLRIVDTATGTEVSRISKSVVSESLTFYQPGIFADGGNYTIDFYADLNGNGLYDPPPTDHAWRLMVGPVTGNDILEFTHNTAFTDIMWPELTGVFVRIPDASHPEGGSFVVPVFVEGDVTDYAVASFQIEVGYDPTVLQLDNVTFENTMGERDWDSPAHDWNQPEPGNVVVIGAGVFTGPKLQGGGALARLHFTHLSGQGAWIDLQDHDGFVFNEGGQTDLALQGGSIDFLNVGPVAGTVTYWQSGVAVDSVWVRIEGFMGQDSTLTNSEGYYEFANVPEGDYDLWFQGVKTDGRSAAITAMDASLILRRVVEAISFDPLQSNAGDPSGNEWVTAYDASHVLAFAVGNYPEFQRPAWTFDHGEPGGAVSFHFDGSTYTEDNVALLVGDVSGNWNLPPAKLASGPPRTVSVATDGRDAWHVGLGAGTPVYAAQLTFEAAAPIEVSDVTPAEDWLVDWRVDGSTLRIALAGAEPITDVSELVSISLAGQVAPELVRVEADLNEGTILPNVQINLPRALVLHAPAPNPFNPSTRLAYQLPTDGPVRVVVSNTLGQTVRVLLDAPQSAGRHAITWDGRDDTGRVLASGAYVMSLRAGGSVLHQRVTLLR